MNPANTRSRPDLIEYLLRIGEPGKEDRAALAALRRGLGKQPGTVAEMYPHVERYIPMEAGRGYADACYVVAALFATHPSDWPQGSGSRRPTNFGASFARLSATDASDRRQSIEKRFVALLNSHRDELPDHLRHAVSLLKSRGVEVDWAQLLRDVPQWDRDDRRVQRKWARAFWAAAPPDEAASGVAEAGDAANKDEDERWRGDAVQSQSR